jgi:hypothetical protein
MAILVDYSQVVIAALHQSLREANGESGIFDEDFLRHLILNMIRSYKKKYGEKYGELIICADSRHSWRKDIFPHYKAHRKAAREESDIDFQIVFNILREVKEALNTKFGYRAIEVHGAEADDIIGVLAKMLSPSEPILILSTDGDFKQLQKYKNVKQYSPVMKDWVKCPDPHGYLKEHIIRGDKGDGIPNFLTNEDFFVTKGDKDRQKSVSAKKLEVWKTQQPEMFCSSNEMLNRYKLNEKLIDLDLTPSEIVSTIKQAYEEKPIRDGMAMIEYMTENKLRNLISSIEDF